MAEGADIFTLVAVALKLGLYVCALLAGGFGLCVGLSVVSAPSGSTWLRRAAWLGLGAISIAFARVGLTTWQMGDIAMLAMVWDMQKASVLAVGAGSILLFIALVTKGFAQKLLTVLAAASFALSFGLTGHTQALEQPLYYPWIVAGHVFLASFWVSAPFVLWPQPQISDALVQANTKRFGRLASLCVPILFVGGGVLAFKLGGGILGLRDSTYGIALAAKVAFATAALGLGAYNKLRVAKLLEANAVAGRVILQRTLSADVALFTAALIAITLATTLFGPGMD
jgi:copper resistance protein D